MLKISQLQRRLVLQQAHHTLAVRMVGRTLGIEQADRYLLALVAVFQRQRRKAGELLAAAGFVKNAQYEWHALPAGGGGAIIAALFS